MAKIKEKVDAERVAAIVAEALAKRPKFFSMKSVRMWMSFIGAFFLLWNGYTTFRHEQRVSRNEELIARQHLASIPTLIYWDSLLFVYRYQDSIREAQALDDLADSLYDHRADLEFLFEKSRVERPRFRN